LRGLYVVDTHALIWHLTGDPRLGRNARSILERADRCKEVVLVPSIVLAECLYLLEKKGRGSLFLDLLNAVEAHPAYDIYPLTAAVLREMPNIVGLAELHDRIIVATAKVNNAVLITKDEEIRRSGYIPTIW